MIHPFCLNFIPQRLGDADVARADGLYDALILFNDQVFHVWFPHFGDILEAGPGGFVALEEWKDFIGGETCSSKGE